MLKAVNIYCASLCLLRISGAENKLSRGGWLVGDCENKANSAPAWARWSLGRAWQ